MATANTNLQVTDLDFVNIKTNFINYLKSQNTFKDYNFSGSALSTLLDVLTYNTQYNAFYLNMVANEMFLDTALQRGSVVSHAKLLNYIPHSVVSPTAVVNLTAYNVTDTTSLTLPRFSQFLSEPIKNVPYPFITTDTQTVAVSGGTANFNNIIIKQGIPVTLTFNYTAATNPTSSFLLPDANIDTSSLLIEVYPNPNVQAFDTFALATNYLGLNPTSQVYFLEEATSGYYQINFGNGLIGQSLLDGSTVVVSYIVSNGIAAVGANNFVLTSSIGNYNTLVTPLIAASGGQEKESISSIKYQAPRTYAAQGRAVTTDDYITLIQQNNLGYTFDAVNVWGGQQNDPPAYGQVFIALKPTGGYTFTDTQKKILLESVIKPISVLTVEPTLVDPDYTYIQIASNVLYNQKKTNLTSTQLQLLIQTSIENFAASTLNTFNSTFSLSDLSAAIQATDASIVANESTLKVQKKFYPTLGASQSYTFYFNSPLARGILSSGISSSPGMQFIDPSTPSLVIDGVYIEEVPTSVGGVSTISLINPGFSYQSAPTVTIQGDGSGATAVASINPNGQLNSIAVTAAGNNYTQAVVVITPATGDTTGKNGAAVVTLEGQYGTLRTYYYNNNQVKTILNLNIGTVDYVNGIITLKNFSPYQIDNPLGQLGISATPTTTLFSSSYNRIITVDPYDPTAIVVNMTHTN